MKKMMLLILAFAWSLNAWSMGGEGDEINNGGGLAEKYFFIVYENMETYASICLETDACRLDDSEKKTLSLILAAMPQERKSANQINFASEKASPGFFIIDGVVKAAKTGSKIGDPVYINTDLIYYKNNFGVIQAISLPTALAILLHEMGHHVTDWTCPQLDLMATKVSSYLQNWIQNTPLLPWQQDISATVVEPPRETSFPQVILTVGDTTTDLSRVFAASVFCPMFNVPIPILPFPDLQFGKQKPTGTIFHNVHWEKTAKQGYTGDFTIAGDLTHVCPARSATTGVNSFVARIHFSVATGKNGKPVLQQNSVRIEQTYEPWYKIIQFRQ